MLRTIFNFTLIASTFRLATPLILAALGGLYCERSGVINIALEGIMLAGAFTAALVTYYAHNPWIGIVAAVTAGVLVAAIHGLATINFRANQVVSGTAINILFLGVPALLCGVFFGTTGNTPQLPREQTLNDWQVFDPQSSPLLASICNQNPLVYFALMEDWERTEAEAHWPRPGGDDAADRRSRSPRPSETGASIRGAPLCVDANGAPRTGSTGAAQAR